MRQQGVECVVRSCREGESMEAIDKARELGTEHGKAAAEAWTQPDHECGICDGPLQFVGWDAGLGRHFHCTAGCADEGNAHYSADCCDKPLPEPDLSRNNHALDNLSCVSVYDDAFRAAVEATVRAK